VIRKSPRRIPRDLVEEQLDSKPVLEKLEYLVSFFSLSHYLVMTRIANDSRHDPRLIAEIALRIRLGEEVSGEEITEALEKIRQDELAAEREIIEAEERRIEAEKKKAAKQNPIRRRQK
jgi:hypothetical protein